MTVSNSVVNSCQASDDYRRQYVGVRAIVLGASGFIGRWVARELCSTGARVCLPVRDRKAAEAVFDAYGINGDVYEVDLLDEKCVRTLYAEVRPSIMFNLAGYGVDRTELNEEIAYRTNVGLIENVCNAVADARDSQWTGQHLVNAGTAMEYGMIGGSLDEESDARPITLYGRSKLAGTHSLRQFCQRLKLRGLTARLFSVYGPGESPERLLPSLIRAAKQQELIKLTAGLHLRDFVYVEDVAESLLRLGLEPTVPGGVVNVATGTLSPVRSFVETAAKALGIGDERLQFGALPTRAEEMQHDPVSIGCLAGITGRVPQTTIAEGIRKTLTFTDLMAVKTAAGSMG